MWITNLLKVSEMWVKAGCIFHDTANCFKNHVISLQLPKGNLSKYYWGLNVSNGQNVELGANAKLIQIRALNVVFFKNEMLFEI